MLDTQNTSKQKCWTHKIPMHEKNFWTQELPRRKSQENFIDPWNTHYKKLWTHKILLRKNVGPTKYPKEKLLEVGNIHNKNCWITEISTHKKNIGLRKYPLEKIVNPQNTHKKKMLDQRTTHKKKWWTHEIPTRKILDSGNTCEDTMTWNQQNPW